MIFQKCYCSFCLLTTNSIRTNYVSEKVDLRNWKRKKLRPATPSPSLSFCLVPRCGRHPQRTSTEKFIRRKFTSTHGIGNVWRVLYYSFFFPSRNSTVLFLSLSRKLRRKREKSLERTRAIMTTFTNVKSSVKRLGELFSFRFCLRYLQDGLGLCRTF